MQPKKQLKVQYIGIFEEIDSFYWPKMHFLKEGQKIWAWVAPPPPPLIRPMPERKVFFSIGVFPYQTHCVRKFLSGISPSAPWLTTTAVGLYEWIHLNQTLAYPPLVN